MFGYQGQFYSDFNSNNQPWLSTYQNCGGYITEKDFLNKARNEGWCQGGNDVALSAFRVMDKNKNGFLNNDDANKSFGYLNRLFGSAFKFSLKVGEEILMGLAVG